MDTAHRQLLNAALAAADRGWHVFPIQPGRKKPPALHGDTPRKPCPRTGICRTGHQGWEQRATTDPDRIRAAWTRAAYNIGIATGPSGLIVIDLDRPKSAQDTPPHDLAQQGIRDGLDHFAAICSRHGQPFPRTCWGLTPRGGTHLYFAAPTERQLRNTEGEHGNGLGWKIDTRAWGGYIVAPGSITPDGEYQLAVDLTPAPLPAWLTALLTPQPVVHTTAPPPRTSPRLAAYTAAAVRGECERIATAAGGTHKKTLYSASGNLGQHVAGGGLSYADAHTELYAAARHLLTADCDCTDYEIRRTITNGLRAGMQRPRIPPAKTRTHQGT
ncbi:bifunctional DNA primase/polymerase [Kibdelosporangium aridum]|uniref:Bifunctional DNA primase/polymerase, N-terminal n=1 Tax=Kibdelosporangium aridum TaxID=2030 RepID=A0A1Y5XMI3_KIBAR|nr:bifunctional DNA primase/polymerase [Kibdelosporangium aridum]SMC98991.1 Bifunctional DNA primase/polymerase, N-terminal [Kibdelosporangium aridum]